MLYSFENFPITASNNITLDPTYPNYEDHKKESLLVCNCPLLGVCTYKIHCWNQISMANDLYTKYNTYHQTETRIGCICLHIQQHWGSFSCIFPLILYITMSLKFCHTDKQRWYISFLNFDVLVNVLSIFLCAYSLLYLVYYKCPFAYLAHVSYCVLFVLFLEEFYDKKICPLLYMLQIFFFHLSSLLGLCIWKFVSIVFMYLSLDIRLYFFCILISA